MRRLVWLVAAMGLFVLAAPAGAQDYRARVQGTVTDSSQGALPGATVTLLNEATGVAATATSDEQGRYLFDFVEPGMYSVSASLGGFKAVELKNIRVQQRQTLTVDLPLEVGGVEEKVIVEAPPVTVQFKSGSAEITLERQLIDQAPIAGRNPYNLSNLDPTISCRRTPTRTGRITMPTPTTTTPAAARAAATTCCSTACRSSRATRPHTRQPWTRSKRSRCRRPASTRRTGTRSAASSA